MYRIMKVVNMLKNKIFFKAIRRNLLKIRQMLLDKEMRVFYRYYRKNEFLKALEVGSRLIHKKGNNPEFLRDYGTCFFYSGSIEEGKRIIFSALTSIRNYDYEKILAYSKKAFDSSTIRKTEYIYLGGHSNYGFIKNDIVCNDGTQKSLISKITWFHSNRVNDENDYCLVLCKKYPELLSLSPDVYAYQKIPESKIVLLTTEYIEKEKVTNIEIDEVIRINKIIESISYKEATALFKNIESKKGRYIPHFLHQKMINQEAICEMKFRADQMKGGQILKSLVNRLNESIVRKKLYTKVQPEIHYSFCHNDFHKNSILVQKNTERYLVIDWDNYSVAMRGWDMNLFFASFDYTFHEIKELYVSTIHFIDPLDEKIAKIYFAFLQVYIWILRLKGNACTDKLTSHFIPAVEFIEEISTDL